MYERSRIAFSSEQIIATGIYTLTWGTISRGERSRDMGSEVSEWIEGVEDVVLKDSEQNMKVSFESRRKTEFAVGRLFDWFRRRVL